MVHAANQANEKEVMLFITSPQKCARGFSAFAAEAGSAENTRTQAQNDEDNDNHPYPVKSETKASFFTH